MQKTKTYEKLPVACDICGSSLSQVSDRLYVCDGAQCHRIKLAKMILEDDIVLISEAINSIKSVCDILLSDNCNLARLRTLAEPLQSVCDSLNELRK